MRATKGDYSKRGASKRLKGELGRRCRAETVNECMYMLSRGVKVGFRVIEIGDCKREGCEEDAEEMLCM